ncbi:hypothetical protein K431DRAFT_284426 [Polychaeton citri CBS 116435]|uniref:Uncharacterized protein n=1 Tax=Polychaeton citri CBS 116435 TaxID=1314669 RepID=A0A9P4QBM4_9PEZI|nr:hypothetical protein K431DRAFT_284426 [Polychaeton citri CBS 116435]
MSPLNITCPPGGTFYACADTSRFLGCCRTNPCATGCPAGNLLPTTFDPAQYGSFGDQQCDAGSFYTCIYPDNSTFVGCCTQPACGDAHECPESSLAGAFLSGNPTKAQVFLELNTTWSQESNSTDDGSTIVTVSDAMASTGSSRPSSAAGHASAHPTSIGAIVGGAVGGFAVIVVLILGLLFVHRRRRRVSSIEEKSQADFPLNPSDRDTIGKLNHRVLPRLENKGHTDLYTLPRYGNCQVQIPLLVPRVPLHTLPRHFAIFSIRVLATPTSAMPTARLCGRS